jgi:hypothetical protein
MGNRNIVCAGLVLLGLCSAPQSAQPPGFGKRVVQVGRTLGAERTEAALSVKAIAAGSEHSLALASDETVWEWGAKWGAQFAGHAAVNAGRGGWA